MRSRAWMLTTMTLFPVLVFPISMVAQQQQQKAEQHRYTVIDLGTLGGTFSWATGINNNGLVDGFSNLPGDIDQHAFLWRDGVMADLGTLGGPNSGLGFWGQKPNERGEIAGTAESSATDPLNEAFCSMFNNLFSAPVTTFECRPFVWRNGKISPLPTLGGNNGTASQINDRGQVVGAAENTTLDPTCVAALRLTLKPAFWEEGVIQELPTLPGDESAVANAINDKGQAVGVSVENCTGALPHAVLWENGLANGLGTLGGTMFDEATDINNLSQVIGFSSLLGDATFHGFFWENGLMTDLGTLVGDSASVAIGINSKGQVVGTSCVDPTLASCRAFISQNGVMTDLNTLTADSALFLLWANRINPRGEIVGLALNTTTQEAHAFLASPGGSAPVAQRQISQRLNVVLPENVRKLLRQQLDRWHHIP